MKRKQSGVTMIGWIFLLIPLAIVLYAGLLIGPEYFNYYKVVTAMEKTASQLKGDETLTPMAIRQTLEKYFDTGYVDNPKAEELKYEKGDKGWTMTADYEANAKMFGNLYLVMEFKKTVAIN